MLDEQHARDGDCQETVRWLQRRLAEMEAKRARMAAAIERDRALMRAENTMLRARLAEITAVLEARQEVAQVPLPRGRHLRVAAAGWDDGGQVALSASGP